MWMRWMVPAFIFNGLCVFGLRVLKEWGLRDQYRIKYLAFWYAGALALALIVWIAKRPKFRPVDIVVGCVPGFLQRVWPDVHASGTGIAGWKHRLSSRLCRRPVRPRHRGRPVLWRASWAGRESWHRAWVPCSAGSGNRTAGQERVRATCNPDDAAGHIASNAPDVALAADRSWGVTAVSAVSLAAHLAQHRDRSLSDDWLASPSPRSTTIQGRSHSRPHRTRHRLGCSRCSPSHSPRRPSFQMARQRESPAPFPRTAPRR